ncbi:MAG: hypothetical protein AB1665_01450 [Candidatus Thermoplasmatota archaeon]
MKRETAWRIFAGELNEADLEMVGEGERAPTYLVTPLGAKVNRIIAVGVLTDVENSGSEENPFWKARISDPTGTFFVSAGQFHAEAAAMLSKLKPPCFAAVIGKVRAYSPEPTVTYVSVRPETVKEVDAATRDHWVLEACKSLRLRLHAIGDAMALDPPTKESLSALGYGDCAEGLLAAIEHYKEIDISRYKNMLFEGLRYLLPEYQESFEVEAEEEEEVEEPDVLNGVMAPTTEEAEVLALFDELDANGKGVALDALLDATKPKRWTKDQVEAMLESLKEKGHLYEPKLGRFMRS